MVHTLSVKWMCLNRCVWNFVDMTYWWFWSGEVKLFWKVFWTFTASVFCLKILLKYPSFLLTCLTWSNLFVYAVFQENKIYEFLRIDLNQNLLLCERFQKLSQRFWMDLHFEIFRGHWKSEISDCCLDQTPKECAFVALVYVFNRPHWGGGGSKRAPRSMEEMKKETVVDPL